MSKNKLMITVTAGIALSTFMSINQAEVSGKHIVKSGDSLWKIARQHNMQVNHLMKINALTSDLIFPNQVLKITESSQNKKSPEIISRIAKTYIVKSGDTLSEIAANHNISLSELMKWNNLETTLIFPGNKFYVEDPTKEKRPKEKNSKETIEYVVKSGDTLSHIALDYKLTVSQIKSWNHLKSDMIYIGQKLTLYGEEDSTKNHGSQIPTDVNYDIDKLLSVANSMRGVKYVWGGQTPAGFDCSGFVHYTYNAAGLKTTRTSSDGYFNRSYYVDEPKVGDLVFFKNTYRSGISHLGIYIGNNEFIHSGSSTGVTVSNLNNSYWKNHFDSFKRFY